MRLPASPQSTSCHIRQRRASDDGLQLSTMSSSLSLLSPTRCRFVTTIVMIFATCSLGRAWCFSPRPMSTSRRCLSRIGSNHVLTRLSSSSSAAMSDVSASNSTTEPLKRKRKRSAKSREKRKEFIGMAKAVDRGQWKNTYKPGGDDGFTFEAKSGLPDRTRLFTVLGIESSCDDTGAALVRSDGVILGESLASQHDIHEEWGGVVPGLARDAHVERMDGVIAEALERADLTMSQVDAIGVTVGPGLEICLRVGCNKARELALEHRKPFVGIHHLEAHILMARMPLSIGPSNDGDPAELIRTPATLTTHETVRAMEFPFLALLVSGGHCQILKCMGIGRYSIIGGTIDDSLGEAFDKTARLLGLPVGGGGGPAVEQLARDGDPKAVTLPVPLRHRKDCDFSYAGLKTAVMMAAEKIRKDRQVETVLDLTHEVKADIASSFQHVAIRHIEQRLDRAMVMMEKDNNEIRSLAVVGGVAANTELRSRLEALCANRPEPWNMFVPPPRLCTDQGGMSAWAAIERLMVGSSDSPHDQEVFARYPFSVQ